MSNTAEAFIRYCRDQHLYLDSTKAKEFYKRLPNGTNSKKAYESVLNYDLRTICEPKLPSNIASPSEDRILEGPFVVQLQSSKDIGAPKSKQYVNAHPSRILSLQLTDGQTLCRAIEYQKTHQLSLGLAPGTKLKIQNITIRGGIILLEPSSVSVIGGRVEKLYNSWKLKADAKGRTKATDRQNPPPPFVPIDFSAISKQSHLTSNRTGSTIKKEQKLPYYNKANSNQQGKQKKNDAKGSNKPNTKQNDKQSSKTKNNRAKQDGKAKNKGNSNKSQETENNSKSNKKQNANTSANVQQPQKQKTEKQEVKNKANTTKSTVETSNIRKQQNRRNKNSDRNRPQTKQETPQRNKDANKQVSQQQIATAPKKRKAVVITDSQGKKVDLDALAGKSQKTRPQQTSQPAKDKKTEHKQKSKSVSPVDINEDRPNKGVSSKRGGRGGRGGSSGGRGRGRKQYRPKAAETSA